MKLSKTREDKISEQMWFFLYVTHLVIWGTDNTCSVPMSCPRCHSSPPDWSEQEAACCYTKARRDRQTVTNGIKKVSSVVPFGVSCVYTHCLLGCGLLEAAPLRFVSGGDLAWPCLVRSLDLRLVERLDDYRRVWRVVNTQVDLHWEQRKPRQHGSRGFSPPLQNLWH